MTRIAIGTCALGIAAFFAGCAGDLDTGNEGGGAAGEAGEAAADGGTNGSGGLGGVDPGPVGGARPIGASGGAGEAAEVGGLGGGAGLGGEHDGVGGAGWGGDYNDAGGAGSGGERNDAGAGSGGDYHDAGGAGSNPDGTPTPFSYASLPTSLVRDRCLYDHERLAVYTNNMAQYFGPGGEPRIERHRYRDGAWRTDALLLNGPPRDIAFTRAHDGLVAISPSTLYEINLESWTITHHVDLSSLAYPFNVDQFSRLAVTSDSSAIVLIGGQHNTYQRYDLMAHTLHDVTGMPRIYGSIAPVASADGSRVLFGQNGISGPVPLYYLDTAKNEFVEAHPDLTVGRMSYDRTGTTALIDGTVYDGDFNRRGAAPDLILSVLSPDGTRGYGYVDDGTPNGRTLRTFDVTEALPNGNLVEVATRIEIPDDPGAFATLGIADDGQTVFISGEEHLIVQPLPAAVDE